MDLGPFSFQTFCVIHSQKKPVGKLVNLVVESFGKESLGLSYTCNDLKSALSPKLQMTNQDTRSQGRLLDP